MVDKPPHGAACNRCGVCCQAEPCVLGSHVFYTTEGPCPALRMTADGSACNLITDPADACPGGVETHGKDAMVKAAKVLIGSGIGCDSQVDGEPESESFAACLQTRRDRYRDTILHAAAMWGLPYGPAAQPEMTSIEG